MIRYLCEFSCAIEFSFALKKKVSKKLVNLKYESDFLKK